MLAEVVGMKGQCLEHFIMPQDSSNKWNKESKCANLDNY